jgi:hypothetical protein
LTIVRVDVMSAWEVTHRCGREPLQPCARAANSPAGTVLGLSATDGMSSTAWPGSVEVAGPPHQRQRQQLPSGEGGLTGPDCTDERVPGPELQTARPAYHRAPAPPPAGGCACRCGGNDPGLVTSASESRQPDDGRWRNLALSGEFAPFSLRRWPRLKAAPDWELPARVLWRNAEAPHD